MIQLHLPWLELAILLPLLGALWVRRQSNPETARFRALIASGATLICTIGVLIDFSLLHVFEAHDKWDLFAGLLPRDMFVVDELSAPLLPLGAMLYFLTQLATLRTKVRRFSFSWTLFSESVLLATLACKAPWGVIALLAIGTIPPYFELRHRQKPTRVYVLHMGLFVTLLVAGQALIHHEGAHSVHSALAIGLIAAAVLLRSGIVPVHCWMTDLFEHASFGTALLFVTPMVGAYGAMRLVLPVAPDSILQAISFVSLFTSVYAAGMALVQQNSRRFFCYLFLSHSSLVLVGLESATALGLTGALCVWLSVGLSLGGFGITLRCVETRCGELSLKHYHGLFEHMPILAGFFLLTGLASIGFPGTIGFIAVELLVEGAIDVTPWAGVAVVIAAALNGLAVMHAYFHVFTGTVNKSSIDLSGRRPERLAVLVLTVLILGGGVFPGYGVASRYHAALELIRSRSKSGLHVLEPEENLNPSDPSPHGEHDDHSDDDDHDDDHGDGDDDHDD